MSFLDIIFGAPKLVDNVFDKDKGLLSQVGQWVGHQQFTEEEKAIHDAGIGTAVRGFAVATLGENTERSKTRRTIAVEWINMQIWLIKLTVLAVFLDYLIVELRGGKSSLAESITVIAFSPMLWGITGAVSVFFFGTHMMRSSKLAK
jgi:hypothetical protein